MSNSTAAAALIFASAIAATAAEPPPYDMSLLPAFVSTQKESGVIRIHGSQLTFPLIHRWKKGFFDLNRDVRYRDNMLPSWFSGLCAGTEDLTVMGHEAWRPDLMAFQECFGYEPFEILIATGGYDQEQRGNTPGVVILVHKDNPVSQLTLDQLDGILGAQRSGGWVGTQWSTASARGPEKNIRTWGQLGLKGQWKNRPIVIYGTDATQSLWAGTIQRVVFKGGTKWNPAINEMVRGDHIRGASDVQTVAAVANNPFAIGFQFMKVVKANPGVKPVALGLRPEGPFIAPMLESFYRRTYPLVTGVYIYVNRPAGKPLQPRLKAFLSYILSREGQQAIVDDGMYIPLTPDMAREQLRKLD
jgi:phosphate transport system substrate-binding protein